MLTEACKVQYIAGECFDMAQCRYMCNNRYIDSVNYRSMFVQCSVVVEDPLTSVSVKALHVYVHVNAQQHV